MKTLTERYTLQDLVVDGYNIKWSLLEDNRLWTGFIWLRIGNGGSESSGCIKFRTFLTGYATVSFWRGTFAAVICLVTSRSTISWPINKIQYTRLLLYKTHITLSLYWNITCHSELALLFKMALPKDVICHYNVAFISWKAGSHLLHVQTQATCQ